MADAERPDAASPSSSVSRGDRSGGQISLPAHQRQWRGGGSHTRLCRHRPRHHLGEAAGHQDERDRGWPARQLAAGIAHQLNTPLGSILLAQMLEKPSGDDELADVRCIIRQTEQCRGIIKGRLIRCPGEARGVVNLAEAEARHASARRSISPTWGDDREAKPAFVIGKRNEPDRCSSTCSPTPSTPCRPVAGSR
jgi:signal transduction histidine kinase